VPSNCASAERIREAELDDNEQIYRTKVLQVLRGHIGELDSMERAITNAAKQKAEIPSLKEIFKEMGDATGEILSVTEFYQDETIPSDLANVVRHVLTHLTDCSSALVLYSSLIGFKSGA
jgi:hypothetical protein